MVYLSCCLGVWQTESREDIILHLAIHKWNKCLHGLHDLHLWMGSTVILKMVGWAGYVTGACPELQHILHQQKRINRQMMAPPIMARSVVNIQWLGVFSLASLAVVSNLWSRISTSNFHEILVQSFSMAEVTTSFSGCWKSSPNVQVQSSLLEWISISLLSLAVMMWSMVLM